MVDINTKIKQIREVLTPFDLVEDEALLDEIQGNILKSHGRNHSNHLFLKFTGNPQSVKQWIGNFTHQYVTSALAQAEQAKQHRQGEGGGQLFGNFFLTRAGYMYLDYQYGELPNDNPFKQGMKDFNIQSELGDDVEQWESGFQQEIHALVLLAADRLGERTKEAKLKERNDWELLRKHPALLTQKVEKIKAELEGIAEVVHEEIGYVLRDKKDNVIEHFGFRDGVSQPLFLKADIDKAKEHSDFSKWDPSAPLDLILFKDPLGEKEESYGSFLVYRKLEQNVKAWNNDVVNNLAEKLKGSGAANPALAGAYTMGRFPDGTPVVLQDTPTPTPEDSEQLPVENNFNYEDDKEGFKCPFHAHARKVNPRGDTKEFNVPLEEEKMHRIARRAINYGHLPTEEPETDAGLLFLCFQANLAEQFNFIQKAWANERNFIKRDVGTDVVIGVEKEENGAAVTETYQWPTEWGKPEKTEADFTHWVNMKGGEYFFAPCMSFLKSFAPPPTRNIVFRGVPKQEIQAAQNTIKKLKNFKRKNWGIGLNGETNEPDRFLRFFNQRNLPFKFYVESSQVAVGEPSAYKENIATLNQYIEDVCNQEIKVCEYKIAELKEYKELYWAIGLNGDTLEPDGFVRFFGERELPFKFFVEAAISMGDQSAYDENIKTLENYIKDIKQITD